MNKAVKINRKAGHKSHSDYARSLFGHEWNFPAYLFDVLQFQEQKQMKNMF